MLSQTAEHALRALLYLAGQPATRPASAGEIAAAIGAPKNYLAKTLNVLAKRGFVTGTRGPGGGFRLDLDPAEIPVYRLVEEFAPVGERQTCLVGGRPCSDVDPCVAHSRWMGMWDRAMDPLRQTTLADLLKPVSDARCDPNCHNHPHTVRNS